MNNDLFSWILTAEIVAPFIILSIILTIALMRNKSTLKRAMRSLIISIKHNEADHLQALESFLRDRLNFSDTDAATAAKEILKERKFYFRSLVTGVLNRDEEALAGLDEELTRFVANYHKLEAKGLSSVPEISEPSDSGAGLQSELESKQAEIEQLTDEKEELRKEVHKTLTTLNNIFAEYSSMFGEDIENKNLSVEQILTAMESFSSNAGPAVEAEAMVDDAPSENDETAEADEAVEAPESFGVDDEADDDVEDEEELDFGDGGSAEGSSLDDMQLEDISDDDDEPDWGDAFAESGDEMPDEPPQN